jgi:Cu(I)/Ag(I) efflux system membrane fusion protein
VRKSRFLGLVVAALAAVAGCDRSAPSHGDHTPPPAPAASAEVHAAHGVSSATPGGMAPFQTDVSRLTALGLETVVVEHAQARRAIRTVGVVGVDETKTSHVHAKVKGFVEGVSADYVGKKVKRGEALCVIFSQQVVAAQLEYLALFRARKATRAALGEDGLSGDSIMDAAKQRLALWDVPASVLTRLEATGEPSRSFGISAPRGGTVVARQAYVGAYVEQGTELFTISDLSRLWVQIDLYEADVTAVPVGTEVALTIEGVGGPIRAPITFLAPTIDESTRTLRARIELDNADGNIRPGAFAHAELETGEGHGLFIPESAVIRTGKRSVVFIVHGEHVEPREVKLGRSSADRVQVDSGLKQGEHVATGAQFLLDAESRLRASSSPGGAHAGH